MAAASTFRSVFRRGGPWVLVAFAVVVGAASALVAVALREGVHELFHALSSAREHTLGFLLPAAGALLGVVTVRVLFREPGGHGVPAVLESVSRKGGFMRHRSVVSRLFGSLLNVAGGGSAGLEGPIVYSSAAIGSVLAQRGALAERQRILLLACGVAGGIGAVFNAPLTGIIFAAEVVLAEWTLGAVIPIAVSATVATELGRALLGGEGAFLAGQYEWGTADLAASGVLGALCGLLSVVLVRSIFLVERGCEVMRRRPGPWGRPGVLAALAGVGVGLLGWLWPEVIGEGYDTVNSALRGSVADGLLLMGLLVVGKIVATSLTLGSGAPGGIFAPSLVLGALLGGLFGDLLETVVPGHPFAPAGFFSLVAMAGLVSGTMQAPLTGIFLALETTSGWSHSLPLILVAVLSVLVSRSFHRHSFYTWELAESGRLLRPGTDRRILADFQVGEMLDLECATIDVGSTLDDLVARLPLTTRNHFAVLDPETRALAGMLNVTALRPFIFDEALRRVTPVDTVMETQLPEVHSEDTVLFAMEAFEQSGAWVLPVVDADGAFVGTLSKSTLFDRYRRELIVQTSERNE